MKSLIFILFVLLIFSCNNSSSNELIIGHWKSTHGSLEGVEEITKSSISIHYKNEEYVRTFPYELKEDSLFVYNNKGKDAASEYSYLIKFIDKDNMLFLSNDGSFQYRRITKEEFDEF